MANDYVGNAVGALLWSTIEPSIAVFSICLPSWVALIRRASSEGFSSLFSTRSLAPPPVIEDQENTSSSLERLYTHSYERLGPRTTQITPESTNIDSSVAHSDPPTSNARGEIILGTVRV